MLRIGFVWKVSPRVSEYKTKLQTYTYIFKLTHIYLNTLIRTYLQQIKKLFTVKTPPVELQDRTDIQEVHSVNPILTFK